MVAKNSRAKPKKTRPSPRGLLPTPLAVKRMLARELKDHPVVDRERQRLTDFWNMMYYFGGQPLVYRNSPKGVEVLAVGHKEVREFYRQLNGKEDLTVVYDVPDRWPT